MPTTQWHSHVSELDDMPTTQRHSYVYEYRTIRQLLDSVQFVALDHLCVLEAHTLLLCVAVIPRLTVT